MHFRQGDVLIKKVRSIPNGLKREEPEERIVLAYGEVTGHAHAIHELENVDVFVGDGRMYLRVKDHVTLWHEEHSAIVLPPGNYERVIQREYQPDQIRQVMD